MEAGEMRSDVDLLVSLVDSDLTVIDRATGRPVILTRKTIAHWTGMSVQTVSDYCSGKYNIPIDFWRRIIERHFDPRVVALLIGDRIPYEVILYDAPEPETSRDFFRRAVEESGVHHETQTRIADILADGQVDELDGEAVHAYAEAWARHRQVDSHLHRSIITAFNNSLARKARA